MLRGKREVLHPFVNPAPVDLIDPANGMDASATRATSVSDRSGSGRCSAFKFVGCERVALRQRSGGW